MKMNVLLSTLLIIILIFFSTTASSQNQIKNQNMNNQKPSAPIITGPKTGTVHVLYEWNFLSIDPEGQNITYYVDWGDVCGGAEYYGPYPSGEEASLSHAYQREYSFIIVGIAIDEMGAESNMTYYEVTIPKLKTVQNSPLLKILERTTFLSNILNFFKLINL